MRPPGRNPRRPRFGLINWRSLAGRKLALPHSNRADTPSCGHGAVPAAADRCLLCALSIAIEYRTAGSQVTEGRFYTPTQPTPLGLHRPKIERRNSENTYRSCSEAESEDINERKTKSGTLAGLLIRSTIGDYRRWLTKTSHNGDRSVPSSHSDGSKQGGASNSGDASSTGDASKLGDANNDSDGNASRPVQLRFERFLRTAGRLREQPGLMAPPRARTRRQRRSRDASAFCFPYLNSPAAAAAEQAFYMRVQVCRQLIPLRSDPLCSSVGRMSLRPLRLSSDSGVYFVGAARRRIMLARVYLPFHPDSASAC